MSDPLQVRPEFFEDLAVQVASDLVNNRLINPNDFAKVIDQVRRRLAFQHNLQATWQEGDEETHSRFRMDLEEK